MATRRVVLKGAIDAALLVSTSVLGQTLDFGQISGKPLPRDWSGTSPLSYPDPDVIALDPRFNQYILFNTPLQRLYTGSLWAEGPAWNGVGKYLVWSDIPNNTQLRWLDENNHVSVFRQPSHNSNGNTFDFQGRQLSAEHAGRRIVRYEHSGNYSVIADSFEGKKLNSPNDIVVHPDGSIWFTDPIYGLRGDYEGEKAESELPGSVYRVDPHNGEISRVTEDVVMPNGLCFSPDYKTLYIADTGADEIRGFALRANGIANRVKTISLQAPGGVRCAADGVRCDTDGNLWCGAYPGVQVVSSTGAQLGLIRLPEICSNVCFGGEKRNRLFMTASQSLYALYVGTRGAHIC
jgi:gluconolactonase